MNAGPSTALRFDQDDELRSYELRSDTRMTGFAVGASLNHKDGLPDVLSLTVETSSKSNRAGCMVALGVFSFVKRLRYCLPVFFLLGLPVFAQDAAPVIRVETRLVNVPVNVADAHGAPVSGLTQDDFTVKEDGRTQKIAIFEREASTPLSIVMAVDTSGSVLSQFRTERDAAKTFAKTLLRPEDEMDLISFAYDATEVVSYTNDWRRIDDGLKRLNKGEDTALYDAIYVASERLTEAKPDATRRRVLVLITDGGDNSIRKEIGYQKAVAEAHRAGAAIYPIIIMPILSDAGRNVAGEHALIQMAEDTGGKYFYVTEKEDLKTAFAHLSDDLRNQYLIGYYSPKRGNDSSLRRISVTLNDPTAAQTLSVRSKTGYYADAR